MRYPCRHSQADTQSPLSIRWLRLAARFQLHTRPTAKKRCLSTRPGRYVKCPRDCEIRDEAFSLLVRGQPSLKSNRRFALGSTLQADALDQCRSRVAGHRHLQPIRPELDQRDSINSHWINARGLAERSTAQDCAVCWGRSKQKLDQGHEVFFRLACLEEDSSTKGCITPPPSSSSRRSRVAGRRSAISTI